MSKNIILSFSGGLDSTCLLLKLLADGDQVRCLSVDYGQRHRKELDAAHNICVVMGVEHKIVDLSSVAQLMAGSSQTDKSVPVPHGRYDDEVMRITVVPNRNAILLSVAGAWAVSTKSDAIAYAAHKGDISCYPDCREEFVRPLTEAFEHADWHKFTIERPFIHMSKGEIAVAGLEAERKLCGEHVTSNCSVLALSWTCYEGGDQPCGLCGACTERREAFEFAGVHDPALTHWGTWDAAKKEVAS